MFICICIKKQIHTKRVNSITCYPISYLAEKLFLHTQFFSDDQQALSLHGNDKDLFS
jgi:hypothetical protein